MTDAAPDRAALLEAFVTLAAAAGDVVRRHFREGCAVTAKADASPVTAADHEAEALILAGLAAAAPALPVVAEEEAAAGRMPALGTAFVLVDPLDGTREFVARRDDFTVNIALVEDGRPTLGVVDAPALGRLWAGDATLGEAWVADRPAGNTPGERRRLSLGAPARPPRALTSRSALNPATEAWLAAVGAGERRALGSSLKFCLLAAGEAEVYPRAAPTMEWDTAAGDAILRAAGGQVLGLDGAPLAYGKPGLRNPGFVAAGRLAVPPLGRFLDQGSPASA